MASAIEYLNSGPNPKRSALAYLGPKKSALEYLSGPDRTIETPGYAQGFTEEPQDATRNVARERAFVDEKALAQRPKYPTLGEPTDKQVDVDVSRPQPFSLRAVGEGALEMLPGAETRIENVANRDPELKSIREGDVSGRTLGNVLGVAGQVAIAPELLVKAPLPVARAIGLTAAERASARLPFEIAGEIAGGQSIASQAGKAVNKALTIEKAPAVPQAVRAALSPAKAEQLAPKVEQSTVSLPEMAPEEVRKLDDIARESADVDDFRMKLGSQKTPVGDMHWEDIYRKYKGEINNSHFEFPRFDKTAAGQNKPELITVYRGVRAQSPLNKTIGEFFSLSKEEAAEYGQNIQTITAPKSDFRLNPYVPGIDLVYLPAGTKKTTNLKSADVPDMETFFSNAKLESRPTGGAASRAQSPAELTVEAPPVAAKGEMNLGDQPTLGNPKLKALSSPMESSSPKGKLVTKADVIKQIESEFKIPIRTGRFRQQAAGIYRTGSHTVRTDEWGNLPTISHELGHHIQNKYLGGFGGKSGLIAPGGADTKAKKELFDLGKELYGDQNPVGGYHSEGFAEFLAMRLTGSDTKAVAPEFTKYFDDVLKAQPELAAKLNRLQPKVTNWYQQGSYNRVLSQIDKGGINATQLGQATSGFRKAVARFKDLWVNSGATVELFEREARGVKRITPLTVRPSTSPSLMYRADALTSSAKARSMVMDGVFDYAGNKTYGSLKDVLSPVSKNIDNWLVYAYGRRALDLHKRNINPGISLVDAQYQVSKLESPEFRKALEGVTEFEDRVLDYLVDAGGMSPETKEAIRVLNPIHIPLKRAFVDQKLGTGSTLANVSSPIKRIKGSGRPIVDPLESIVQQTTNIISTADRIRVMRSIVDLAEQTKGMGKWVEKIPPPQNATQFSLDKIKDQLSAAGINISRGVTDVDKQIWGDDIGQVLKGQSGITPDDLDQILTVFTNNTNPQINGKENIVSVWRNGKREYFELDPQLYKSVMQMDYVPQNLFLKWFGAPARSVRLGATGLNPGFSLVTNFIRDMLTFTAQSEFTKGSPHNALVGLYRKFRPTEVSELYKRSGVDMSAMIGMDRSGIRRVVGDILADDKKAKALNVVKHPIDALRDILAFTESGPRRGEYLKAYPELLKKYGTQTDARIGATVAAKDVTTDFSRAGHYAKFANSLIPFFNASIQGADKFARTVVRHPIRAGMWGLGTASVTTGLWMLNKDQQWYKELPEWQKAAFWHFEAGKNPDGTTRIVRIPRPFEWGLAFAAAPEAYLNQMYRKDPTAINEWAKITFDQVTPDVLPASVKPIIEVAANHNFFQDRDIVPFYTEQNKPPEAQFYASTPTTYKELGKLFGYSPLKIQHLSEGYSGGLVSNVVRAFEGDKRRATNQAADIPVFGKLFTRQELQEDRAERIKFETQSLKQKIAGLRKLGKEDEAQEIIQQFRAKYGQERK